jgi:perosamine synthetase
MVTPLLYGHGPDVRDEVIPSLARRGIDARPVVYPVHQLPPYAPSAAGEEFPVAERVARDGINLPTWAGLTRDDVQYVCEQLRECLGATAPRAPRPAAPVGVRAVDPGDRRES